MTSSLLGTMGVLQSHDLQETQRLEGSSKGCWNILKAKMTLRLSLLIQGVEDSSEDSAAVRQPEPQRERRGKQGEVTQINTARQREMEKITKNGKSEALAGIIPNWGQITFHGSFLHILQRIRQYCMKENTSHASIIYQ